jgi:uncharacterized protein YjbI with pentapeptide repeats
MANQEHLDILKQGVEAWNQWRKEHAQFQSNLSGANLRKAIYSGAILFPQFVTSVEINLSYVNLSGANLVRVDFSIVDLSNAYLTGTNLSGANLSGANLSNVLQLHFRPEQQ